ncbi:hypothetical protein OROGR_025379 [Orobanche gracilis]
MKRVEEMLLVRPEPSRSGVFGNSGSSSSSSCHSSGGEQDNVRFQAIKGRRLELPIFDGTDPDGWILRAERYFNLNRLSNEEQLEVAIIAFEGDALRRFQWENKRLPIRTWRDMKMMLLRRFRSNAHGTPCEQFLALKQDGTVSDYVKQYVTLAAPLEGISEEVFCCNML